MTLLECSGTSLFQENQLNWADTQSVSQCLIPANCIRKNCQLFPLVSGAQCIPHVLSSLFSRIPTETYGNQDLPLLFSSHPRVLLSILLPSLVTPLSKGFLAVNNLLCHQCHLLQVALGHVGHEEASFSQHSSNSKEILWRNPISL